MEDLYFGGQKHEVDTALNEAVGNLVKRVNLDNTMLVSITKGHDYHPSVVELVERFPAPQSSPHRWKTVILAGAGTLDH